MKEEIAKLCNWVKGISELQERIGMWYIIEGSPKTVKECYPGGEVIIMKGRGAKLGGVKNNCHLDSEIVTNLKQIGHYKRRWIDTPIQVRIEGDKLFTRSVGNQNWVRWMRRCVTKSMQVTGRIGKREVGFTFAGEIDEVEMLSLIHISEPTRPY